MAGGVRLLKDDGHAGCLWKPLRAQGGRDSATRGRAFGRKMHSVLIVQASKPFIREPRGQTPHPVTVGSLGKGGVGSSHFSSKGSPRLALGQG